MQIVLNLHSIVRWLIVLVAVVAIVKFAISWRRADKFSSIDQRLTSAFSGLIDFQAVLETQRTQLSTQDSVASTTAASTVRLILPIPTAVFIALSFSAYRT